ncbi:uncharacterized protein LOC123559652 isoform X2 [Mercenaria mercenaria]|uniref:uncharacterized protein LOC123559652 isoform X2 n=1 Tax=Mercenaria mercenaria TaxID=6596 RepID=UPI00234EB173|nr:uncharacterized protein LOC123559652 isoform X2 [Mercenaria mercenaria]
MSLYKINPNVIGKIFSGSTEEGNDANCLKLSEERPEWEKCEKSHGTLCSSGSGTFNLSDKPDKSRNWFDAAKQCFKTGKYPISYSTASSPETFEDNSVWTGVFKMNIIYKQLQETSSGYMNSDIRYGYLSSDFYLRFTRENNTKRVLCEKGPIDTTTSSKNKDTKTTKSPPNTSLSVTVSTITAVISVVVAIIIVAVLTVFLTKKRRMNQGTRLTEVGYVPEQTNNITPISEKARDGDYTTIQDIGTGKEIEIQNTQNIVYESLGERNYEEHGYETANTQTSVYESLGERHDEEHNYGTPTTHRSAYESLGERHDEEHGYGTPNTQRSSYESLGERRDEEHSYGVSTQARSGFHQPLEEEMVEAHNYKIAEQPRELAYDSLGDKIKETHCDKTSDQTAYVRPYEWVE